MSIVNARVCADGAPGSANCLAIRHDVIDRSTGKPVQMSATSGFGSKAIRTAYGITGEGTPATVIAIVDAYDAPSAATDLAAYRTAMGLPNISTGCAVSGTTINTTAGPCFVKVGQSGSTSSLPRADRGWAQEIDLDLQMASTVCPMCSILLVEANSSSMSNLNAAVATAASFAGVRAISNSYGGSDMSQSSATAYNDAAAKGIAVTASTGDNGYGDSYPASSSNVIAVGGTSLTVDSSGVRSQETAWSGAGSGCSSYNPNPGWQVTACGNWKANADVSAVADPNTGVSVYYNGAWYVFGGTSVSSPIVGSWLALNYANWSGSGGSGNASKYVWSGPTWSDVTSGSNGSCGTAVCNAGPGWDGPTGLGSLPKAAATVGTLSTSTGVTPASESVAYGAGASIAVSVTPSDTGTPTGTVTLTQGSTTLGSCSLGGSGTASCSINFTVALPVGGYTLTATYGGDSNYASSSASNALTVTQGSSVTNLTAPSTASTSQAVTLAVAITPSSATGTVQFYDGTTPIGDTVTVASGSASLSWTFTTTGTHSISALYSGDSNLTGSTSNSVSVSVSTLSAPGVIDTVTAATGSRKGTITATWQAPSSGGSPITGYVVKVYTAAGGFVVQGKVTSTSVLVTHLTSGALYYVTVAAVNAIAPQTTATQSNTVPAG